MRIRVSAGSYGDDERERFYKLANSASDVLNISNPELAQRAELGDAFFATLIRDRRYPKLENFLRALTAMIEVANERLFDVDRNPAAPNTLQVSAKITQRIQQDRQDLLVLSKSLAQMALNEIDRLDAERPNDPDRVKDYEKQRELLKIFADGFARIADALAALEADRNHPVRLSKAVKAIESVGDGISRWWKANEDEAIDWAFRIPVLTAGVAALGWAGANMTVGTTVVAALVGGTRVLKAIGKRASTTIRKRAGKR
ncbi:hypothetical protein UP09_16490 [Bradyrhizobium sp. LTSP885]|uniref:hypothetical protein n=1 Tax=Bradyrhizobium sp. LTSP885 TaxID=1619232 RepID=UPI0005C9F73B|nr:hypothetical protein [Bradyrhizobium sp. LTSP885]KJC43945.1 hypothetical protein UP09_16490 [Bradyrhizobium sp. LTSP885]